MFQRWHLLQHGCSIDSWVSGIVVSIQDVKVMEDAQVLCISVLRLVVLRGRQHPFTVWQELVLHEFVCEVQISNAQPLVSEEPVVVCSSVWCIAAHSFVCTRVITASLLHVEFLVPLQRVYIS